MLNLCDDEHVEICYTGRECPMCQLQEMSADTMAGLATKLHEARVELKAMLEDVKERSSERSEA